MNDQELLKSVLLEIETLRKQNQIMRARLDMFDDMMRLLHTTPAHKSEGMSPDIAYEVKKRLAELDVEKRNNDV
jgi:hypothetical protein